MIAISIDFFEKVDKFLNDNVTTHEIIFDYYLNFIPWINGLLWPLFSLIAVIFFTSRMAKDLEIVAILSAGISYRRMMLPYLLASTIIGTLLWLGNNYVIPNSTRVKNEFESEYIRRSSKKPMSNNIHFFLNPNQKIYIRYFRIRDSSAQNFRLETFKGNRLVSVLKANKLEFKEEPNTWTLNNYEIRRMDGMNEELQIHKGEKKDTVINISPDDFVRYTKQMEMMTTSDLKEYMALEQSKGIDTAKKFKIELYRRTADPFTILILTLIGVAIASRKVRGGMGFHLAAGVVLGAAFVILAKFSVTFSSNMDLPPGLGVWIPNILFSIIAFYLYIKAQK